MVGCVKIQYIVMCFRSRARSIINLDDDDVNGDNNYVAVDEYVASLLSSNVPQLQRGNIICKISPVILIGLLTDRCCQQPTNDTVP